MTDYQLEDSAPEDIEDLLKEVELSFNIRFVGNELTHIKTFGQLCDHISNKMQGQNADDCTTQQAFYKLRQAIAETLQVEKKTISPDTELKNLFPEISRRRDIRKLEQKLDFKLNMLRPPHWMTITLAILFLASLIMLFFNWKIGLIGICFSVTGSWTTNKTGKEIDLVTVGQLAEKMTRENYFKARRNPESLNRNEIENILRERFSDGLDLDKLSLNRDARF